MRKTVEKIYCDDCHKLVIRKDVIYTYFLSYFHDNKDICVSCITDRLNHSFSICEDRTCDECRGTGKIKEFYYHNEYNENICSKCGGYGVVELHKT